MSCLLKTPLRSKKTQQKMEQLPGKLECFVVVFSKLMDLNTKGLSNQLILQKMASMQLYSSLVMIMKKPFGCKTFWSPKETRLAKSKPKNQRGRLLSTVKRLRRNGELANNAGHTMLKQKKFTKVSSKNFLSMKITMNMQLSELWVTEPLIASGPKT